MMTTNEDCIIIKKSEYEDLVERANAKIENSLVLTLKDELTRPYNFVYPKESEELLNFKLTLWSKGSFQLKGTLKAQITRLTNLLEKRFTKSIKEHEVQKIKFLSKALEDKDLEISNLIDKQVRDNQLLITNIVGEFSRASLLKSEMTIKNRVLSKYIDYVNKSHYVALKNIKR